MTGNNPKLDLVNVDVHTKLSGNQIFTESRKDGMTEGQGESSIAPLFQSGAIKMNFYNFSMTLYIQVMKKSTMKHAIEFINSSFAFHSILKTTCITLETSRLDVTKQVAQGQRSLT